MFRRRRRGKATLGAGRVHAHPGATRRSPCRAPAIHRHPSPRGIGVRSAADRACRVGPASPLTACPDRRPPTFVSFTNPGGDKCGSPRANPPRLAYPWGAHARVSTNWPLTRLRGTDSGRGLRVTPPPLVNENLREPEGRNRDLDRFGEGFGELAVVKVEVEAASGQELLVRSLLDDLAAVHDEDRVGIADRR